MHETVSDILNERARQAHGINQMLMVSLAAHGVLLALVVAMPAEWRSMRPLPEREVMTISLGGAPGPADTGMTQMSSRTVQTVAPPDVRPNVRDVPAAAPPELTVPDPIAKPRPTPTRKPVEKPADKSTARQPTAGARVGTGATRADTGAAPVPFGGLASSGGQGYGATLDVKDFCCPAYIQTMVQLIRSNWNQNQGANGVNTVKFTILRDGRLANVSIAKASNNALLDLESRRAVLYTQKLPPLPARFPNPTLTVDLIFEYKR